jgi:hypothetical protein
VNRDFEHLEELANDYRQSRGTLPDGTWLLSELYNGLESGEQEPESAWQARVNLLQQWTNARPQSITARVALANEMVSYAWKARGSGYINSVSTSEYRTFVERAQRTIMICEEAATLAEHCPFTVVPRLIATRGISGRADKFYGPLVDAITADPTVVSYYIEAVVYELPRWHGSSEHSAEMMLSRYADKLGGEEGDVLYARVAWAMQRSGMFSDAMKECHFSWAKVDKGFQALERRFPTALSVKSAHALLGGFAGGRDVAKLLIDKLDGKVDEGVWIPLDQFKEHVRFAYAVKKSGTP